MKEKKRQTVKISIFITSIFVIFISVAYAFINQTLTGTKRQVITAGNLQLELKEDNEVTLENELPMYDEVGKLQKAFTFRLINKTSQNTTYTLKLKDVTEEGKDKLDMSYIRYSFIKDDVETMDYLSNLVESTLDTGTIQGNQTINYSLRLWIDSSVKDETLIKGKALSYKIEIEATIDTSVAAVESLVFDKAAENPGESCKTYDDGVDTFLVGECSQNYVWYSGKLWRIVLKNNETGAVKIVTDNAITSISYNASENTAFEDSYVDQWLTQEFLPTLHDYKNYLVVDSIWDATSDASDTPSRPEGTTTVTRTVGLLNAYEYYIPYNNSDKLYLNERGYLNNRTWWWLMTLYSSSHVRCVNGNGGLSDYNPSDEHGVRPSLNLKSDIRITSGDGTESNPYRLEGDNQETINGITLLSTRYSGEYIAFNNELYRIVGTEDDKTKITAVDKPTKLTSDQFDSSTTNFAESSIKADLETYYQNNVVEPYKAMVEPDQTWYLGEVGDGVNYKASICKMIDAKLSANSCERTDTTTTASVGLPRVGEIFTSQITRGIKSKFWVLTPYSTLSVRCVLENGSLSDRSPSYGYMARPSMYLKSNVVISKNNTGDGTYEHPYDIELAE